MSFTAYQPKDLYAEVTNKIIADLEKGTVPWIKPWKCGLPFGGAAYNAASKKVYRGINTLLLFRPQFNHTGWMTFNQVRAAGGHVRKGEKGSMIVFFKIYKTTEKDKVTGENKDKSVPLLRSFTVFNLDQIDGLPEKYLPKQDERTDVERHAEADKVMAKAKIEHGGDRACYIPDLDLIKLPEPKAFANTESYYATSLHEMGHWTGHKSRLARTFGVHGTPNYAKEELVAEMSAAFMCATLGIQGQLQHADYIASWLSVLKSDKKAIVQAAGLAQKAADLVLGIDPTKLSEDAE
jgi:antirestriction protein ArdC